MKKTIFNKIAVFALLTCAIFGNSTQAADEGDARPVMFGAQGWRQKADRKGSSILHTDDGGKHWVDVSPRALPTIVKKMIAGKMEGFLKDEVALSALDARRAWVSILPYEGDDESNENYGVLLEYTADAGRHWKKITTPMDVGPALIGFVDEQHGYLLALHNGKIEGFYRTENGGERWYVLPVPGVEGLQPTGISFRSPAEGWIIAAEGSSAPLYRTRDGGNTWTPQKLESPAGYRDGWDEIAPPRFSGPDKKHGVLPVKLTPIGTLTGVWINYETGDGGATWYLPASGFKLQKEN